MNRHIRENDGVTTRLMTPDAAIAEGAMALFGEKYGDEVRVLSMGRAADGSWSVELCGGTHVSALGDIGLFKIVSESAVAAGVRRIEALTGEAARQYLTAREKELLVTAETLRARPEDVSFRVNELLLERAALRTQLEAAQRKLALATGMGGVAEAPKFEQVAGVVFLGMVIEGLDPKNLRGLIDESKAKLGSGVAVMVAVNEGRASVSVGVTDDLTSRISAVDLVRLAAAALGGQGGGGRPDMAQAGGPDGSKATEAIAAVRTALAETAVAA